MYLIHANIETMNFIERWLLLFQFIAISFFYLNLLKRSIFSQKIKQIVYLAIIIQIIFFTFSVLFQIPKYVKTVSNIFIILYSVIYYRDLLKTKPTLILIKSSAFGIVTGMFFSFSVSFPIYALNPFIKVYPEYQNIRLQVFSISNIALIVMYLFIIKSYLCLKHPRTTSIFCNSFHYTDTCPGSIYYFNHLPLPTKTKCLF